jgi:hypothetical protein
MNITQVWKRTTGAGGSDIAWSDVLIREPPELYHARASEYGPHNNGENQELARRLQASGVTEIDPCRLADPFYLYRPSCRAFSPK